MIQILTDSTADLSRDLAAAHNISIIPLFVHIDSQEFQDGIDLKPDQLYDLVRKTGVLPKTAAASVAQFTEAFKKADQSIYIGISTQLSATVQNARLAASEFPEGTVRVIDSHNLSTGIGLLALLAADLRDQGCPAEEIERLVISAIPKVRTSFVVETMEYLYKGGRCTAVQALMGSLLKIRPVIEVKSNGTMGVKSKLHGSRAKILRSMLADFESQLSQLNPSRIFVTHSVCPQDADFLSAEIKKLAPDAEVLITEAGAVISSHCGPETIGILFFVN